jgi:hypothetical protein
MRWPVLAWMMRMLGSPAPGQLVEALDTHPAIDAYPPLPPVLPGPGWSAEGLAPTGLASAKADGPHRGKRLWRFSSAGSRATR